jgi:cyclic beta-1,2-glucan synthetase
VPEPPIRAELFGVDRLEQHAESLAVAQPVTGPSSGGGPLLARVEDNARLLRASYRVIATAIREERAITPAAEWLVDNFHVVDEQLREIRDDLSPGFYRKLPKLIEGPLAGYPRVYGIAWAFVAHTDSRFDPEALRRFVQAYQRVQPLTIGELWAVAITLRVVLVENLRRLAEGIVRGRAARQEADALADELLGVGHELAPSSATRLLDVPDGPLATAFAVQLVQRLREQDRALTPAVLWLDRRLAAQGTTSDDIVRVEHQRQAAMNVTVRNVILSMSLMSALDWTEFFEAVSLVDEVLRAAPAYGAVDFATRDAYRHAIEDLASGSQRAELDVARRVVARIEHADTPDDRLRDPGTYLVGRGRVAFEAALGYRAPPMRRLLRACVAAATPGYLGAVLALGGLVLAVPLLAASASGLELPGLLLLALLAAVPASDLAIALLHRGVTALVTPAVLPRLELPRGVPADLRTLIAVPMLLTDVAEVEGAIDRLEVHFLASPDGDLRFAILSDWLDAPSARMPGDDDTLAAAREGIARLNRRHGPAPDGGERFFVFHRRRLWNEGERTWMGWERKRGKLHELNRLLRGATDTSFVPTAAVVPGGVRYVVTLDADTRLPRGAVDRLVATMAHPLNRPRLDPARRRVVEGYGVLQPRVTPPLPGGTGSFFQRLSSGPAGIDPYAAAVSDVYQDLWGEGSFTGKGIYDVDAFEAALAGRVPENTLLSHDLFEGVFARAGLVTDVELFESAPSHYGVAASRQHRWARGDWQLLPWILGTRLPMIGRWKMLDNLRRTVSAPAAFVTLVVAWMLPGASPAMWSAFILVTIAVPALLPALDGVIPRRRGISRRSHVRAVGRDVGLAAAQVGLTVTMLAYQAWLMGDAIVRTLVRVYVTHRRLLEWVTAAQAKAGLRLDFLGFCRRMAGGVALAAAAAAVVTWGRPDASPAASLFLLAWAASPAVARWISVPRRPASLPRLSAVDAQALRVIARRTWRFFVTFVGPEDHALPPDNFQETPSAVVAHRTSPTNIGLYLLSAVAARDFGWMGTLDTVARLEATVETMHALERYRGHFYNWYDTRDCRPLEPRYVSSVDSGNLAGHLLALAQACEDMIERPRLPRAALAGIEDTLQLVRLASLGTISNTWPRTDARLALDEALEAAITAVRRPAGDADAWGSRLADLRRHARSVVAGVRGLVREDPRRAQTDLLVWAEALEATVASHERDLDAPLSLRRRLATLARSARTTVAAMDFGFLFDPMRQLFAIGYRVADGSLDAGRYDLLASEARLASFVAIAKGDVPVSHWFRMGRPLTPVALDSVLVSWSGSMFEYVMPGLVMQAPAGSLLEQTARLVVARQIAYGAERRVPWGVSESAYNVRDLEMTYQYSNFGVPGLGLRRGLSEDVVIAPYATGLAAMIDPGAAVRNFRHLAAAGAVGAYGFYEALDYTAARLPEGVEVAVVEAYMAHHQGMLLVALANVLHDGVMRARFHAEPMVRATELLLQERTPRDVMVARPRAEEVAAVGDVRELAPPAERHFTSPHSAAPRTQLLSNGRYAVMLTGAGSGYSRWRDLAVTRWREDPTCDAWGTYVFLRDRGTGETWSAGYQPRGGEPDSYQVTFSEDRAEIVRRDRAIGTTLQVIVSPEDDAEVRRVSLTNLGTVPHELEVTSYAELVLAPAAADVAHPAFSNLSVVTECVPELDTVLATRRPRSRGAPSVWLAHVVVVDGETVGALQWETDRARFLGRGRLIRTPAAVIDGTPLSSTVGAVLDPVVSLRRCVRLPAGATVRVTFSTLIAPSRADALELAEKYRDAGTFDRVATLAWTHAQVQHHHLGIGADEAHLFQSLAGRVLYADRTLRPAAEGLARATGGPEALWAHGISGDLPIVLVQIDEPESVGIVRQLLRAHEYWRIKRLPVDLVILNEHAPSYVQDLQTLLETLVRTSQSARSRDGDVPPGQVYIVRADRATAAQRDTLLAVARVVVSSGGGTLAEQMTRAQRPDLAPAPRLRRADRTKAPPALALPPLERFNGFGGFSADGHEYVTILDEGRWTPAPWINVIANEGFGFQVSESGSGYTWSGNSRENQLTAWSNDPVSDAPSETFYVRDEETGDLWGPTALPIREDTSPYVIRHGQGYTRFEHAAHGVALDLLQLVPLDDPVKISRLTLTNVSGRARRLSVTAYVEWALGPSRSAAAPYVVTAIDDETGAMFARNTWRRDVGDRVAFADLGGAQTAWTADRTEFLGRHGAPDHPAALERSAPLSGRVGARFDPCGALQVTIDLRAGDRAEIVFVLGEAATAGEARALVRRARTRDLAALLRAVGQHWDDVLGRVQVQTPDRSMDLLLNRWLLYQTLACRVWARAALYQAGGAYGFRDQLQDVTALALPAPALTRRHLLLAASRQFVEGDVQHWWHPPGGGGVRTRISDDLLWLPWAVRRYLDVTGDGAVLDEVVPFLEGATLVAGQHESYFEPRVSLEQGSLFEHCARALDRSLTAGAHGLPLMGTGDWNDGMNEVGAGGRGESVWLGWFLHAVLSEWAPLAEARREADRAGRWRHAVTALTGALDEAWDGEWYRRAYFDDGTPLGSAVNDACRIDSIAQSWSVISGAGDPARQARAMAAVDEHLVRRADGVVALFAPPFDDTPLAPGYIKGYPPGVRENGGQYTHAAIWVAIAFAELGDGDRAAEILAMLNPIDRARNAADVQRYKVEPYAIAGDVYARPPHTGRGGWTWYTGSAGWMYRAGLEWRLGFRVRGARLFVDPCVPRAWPAFAIAFRHRSARYHIEVENPRGVSRGVSSVEVDGVRLDGDRGITLVDDGTTHRVRVVLG